MPKTLPRYRRNVRRASADEVVRPLPPTLVALVAGEHAAVEHDRVATSYSEARTAVASLSTKYEQALTDDEDEQRTAIREGRAAKPPKAPKIADDLERARRELDVAGPMLDESSAELLVASIPYVRQAQREVGERQDALLDEAREMLAGAVAAFEQAARLSAEGDWLARLAQDGIVAPYLGPGAVPWKAHTETRGALRRLDLEREETERRAEQIAREREAADSIRVAGQEQLTRLKAVPGREVWTLPGEDDAPPARGQKSA